MLDYLSQTFLALPPQPHRFDFPKTDEQPPNFFQGSFSQAVSSARSAAKFILVVLHSARNPDSVKFCKEVLCDPRVRSFLEERYVLWGGDVRHEEPYRMANVFGATAYPYIVMLCHFNSSNNTKQILSSLRFNYSRFTRSGANVVDRIQGYIPGPDLIELLTASTEQNDPLLVATRLENEGVSKMRDELQQQDQAFHESLRLDQEKEKEKEEQRRLDATRQAEERNRQQREELERERREKDEQRRQVELAQRELLMKEQREQRRQQLQREIPPEPAKGEPNVLSLMIRFGDGKKVTRRFYYDDPIQLLFKFVESQVEMEKFEIGITHPKREIVENEQTFREANIPPNAVLYVDII